MVAYKLHPCTGRTAHRGSRGIALPFHDHGTRRGWGVSVTPRPLFTPGKDPVPIVQEAGWAPGPVWRDAENLATTGTRSSDRPARSQSLYRLRYPAHKWSLIITQNQWLLGLWFAIWYSRGRQHRHQVYPLKVLINETSKPFTVSKDRCQSCVLSYETLHCLVCVGVIYILLNVIWISTIRCNPTFKARDHGFRK